MPIKLSIPFWKSQKFKSQVRLNIKRSITETHFLFINSARMQKDREIREKQKRHLEADLVKFEESIRKGRTVKEAKTDEAIGRFKECYLRLARNYRIEHDTRIKNFTFHVDVSKK